MSLYVYFYSDEEVGIPWRGPDADRDRHGDFPDPRFNWCAFKSFRLTRDPGNADIFVMRQRLSQVGQGIRNLPYLEGNERKHVFFDVADNYETYPGVDAMFIRASTTRQMMEANPTTIPWPWPTEDFGKWMPTPSGGWQYDVSFQGQANEMAHIAMRSIEDAGLSIWARVNNRFWPHICDEDSVKGERLRLSFLLSMQNGRLSLCPQTLDGVIRYRFYEAMSMARVNVLICDNCVLPLQDKIDWTRCTIPIGEQDAGDVGEILKYWLEFNDDERLWERGLYAREMWAAWLWRGRWADVVDLVVRERLTE